MLKFISCIVAAWQLSEKIKIKYVIGGKNGYLGK